MTYYHYHGFNPSDHPILFVVELMVIVPCGALSLYLIQPVLVPLDWWLTGGIFSPIWDILFNYEAVWVVTRAAMRILLITGIALTVWRVGKWVVKQLAKK